jgi:hypothetical protein
MPETGTKKEMTMTPNIFQRVISVMRDLQYIEKGDLKVNGQYTFVSHDAVSAKVHPLLVKHGIAVIPTVQETKQEHNRTEVKLAVSFVNIDAPADAFTVQYPGYGIDNGDKGPGKAISYAFKYALLKTFCLQTGDDPDNTADASYEPPRCLEFDSVISPLNLSEKDKAKMKKFLAFCSQAMKKHVEEIKKEACQRPEDFMRRFQTWEPEKKH